MSWLPLYSECLDIWQCKAKTWSFLQATAPPKKKKITNSILFLPHSSPSEQTETGYTLVVKKGRHTFLMRIHLKALSAQGLGSNGKLPVFTSTIFTEVTIWAEVKPRCPNSLVHVNQQEYFSREEKFVRTKEMRKLSVKEQGSNCFPSNISKLVRV